MKILYVTTIGGTMVFFQSFIRQLIEQGHTVDIACSYPDKVGQCYLELGCKTYPLSCSRSPLDKGNLSAVKQLKKIVEENHYDIVHCHTPIAAACTRIACRKVRKQGTKVFYTAHGFHFYKGAPLKNWLIFYPIEKLCARWTDVLITINREDYALAQRKLKAKKVAYVPGVGIDVEKFANAQVDRAAKRQEIGVPEDAFLLFSVGELNENKNHQVVIRALAQLNEPNIHYAVAGKGGMHEKLETLARELGIEKQVHLLGYRTDAAELYKTADVFVHPSFREGLPVSIMEARAAGLPVICSDIRGCTDLVNDGQEGYLADPRCYNTFAKAIDKIRVSNPIQGKSKVTSFVIYSTGEINCRLHNLYEDARFTTGEKR